MRVPIPLLFLALVFGEIAGFILVGQAIGVLPTLGLVFLGMAAGVLLLRRQGVAPLMRLRAELATDPPSARPLAEGALLAFAALLILVPGFITDLVGILLYVPVIREFFWRGVRSRVEVRTSGYPQPRPGGPVVDLDGADYARSPRRTDASSDGPWRLPGGPET